MAAPVFSTEAAKAGTYPRSFNKREAQLLASAKVYIDSLSPDTVITTEGDIIVGNSGGDAARLAKGSSGLPLVAGASTVSYAALAAAGLASASVTLAKLATGVSPSHVVKFAGSFTTAGGDANETISVPGVLGTDVALVELHTKGATPRTILTRQAATDAINLEFSGDPSTDHIVRYVVFRAAS